ncbi:DUF6538 domain-containing protein [Sediminimonas sp.]|uniref:DUF6538 domain-containing protein n=1 Tax=Sediminimonas sp. TaxID=2823379 RepID=UPI0025F0D90F|nr:DUF6538 domain-containing protein [Sediminimonas sp.]
MSETISRPLTFVKDGIFCFSHRIPNEMETHYTSLRIAFSLRTRSAKIAEARARKAADQLEDRWYHLRCQDVKLPGEQMPREQGLSSAGQMMRLWCLPHLCFCQKQSGYIYSRRAKDAQSPSTEQLSGSVATSSTPAATNTSTPTPRPMPGVGVPPV